MSSRIGVLLYRADTAAIVRKYLAGVATREVGEAFYEVEISPGLLGAFYQPPIELKPSRIFSRIVSWFAEDLSIELPRLFHGHKSPSVYLLALDEQTGDRHLWIIDPKFRRYSISGDCGVVGRLDEDDDYDEAKYNLASQNGIGNENEALCCGLLRIAEELGVDRSDLINGLHRSTKSGHRVWGLPRE